MDNPAIREQIGQRIRDARHRQYRTQRELGAELGVTPQTVSLWEKGTMLPSPAMQRSLAGVIGLSWADLFDVGDGAAA